MKKKKHQQNETIQRRSTNDTVSLHMASSWKRSVVIVKRVVARRSLFRRGVHATSYDKNPEEDLVHDGEVTREARSDKYWAPHPKTGVFGPEGDDKMGLSGPDNSKESVLEEKAWFRPTGLEDLEKPI